MKQTVEEAAMQELMSSYAIVVEGELVYQRQAMLNMFRKGVEWQAKQSPWISVKERLPENQDIVLVRGEYGGKATAYLHGKDSGFIVYGEDAYKVFGEVTHWMPIPDLEE